jgi:hypothetical protein
MPSAEFEPAIPATKRPQTYASDRAVTGTGTHHIQHIYLPHVKLLIVNAGRIYNYHWDLVLIHFLNNADNKTRQSLK